MIIASVTATNLDYSTEKRYRINIIHWQMMHRSEVGVKYFPEHRKLKRCTYEKKSLPPTPTGGDYEELRL